MSRVLVPSILVLLLIGIVVGSVQVVTTIAKHETVQSPYPAIVVNGVPALGLQAERTRKRLFERIDHLGVSEISFSRGSAITFRTNTDDPEHLERTRWILSTPGRFDLALVADDQSDARKQELLDQPADDAKLAWPIGTAKESRSLATALVVSTAEDEVVRDLRFDECAIFSSSAKPQLTFTLAPADSTLVGRLSRDHIDERVALLLDGEVVTAPTVRAELGRSFVCDVDLEVEVADDIVGLARSGPHPNNTALRVTIEE